MQLYLQNIVDDISFENLPEKWHMFDFVHFSKDKTLFDFQKRALENALKGLWIYFIDKKADKKSFFEHYKLNGLEENFDYDLDRKQDSKSARYLLEYPEDYPLIDNKISFAHFINRMSFWMATGSGKTLIIVKLIEILGKLINKKEIPEGDILFLTHRDDLLNQFKKHVEEFNNFNFDIKINLKNLRDYESTKRESIVPFVKNEITVFYYRSDLISDEHKEKIVNFKNYDNGGKWYILLDEAHKGDKEDSKRQILYNILSRNGFLFNFSATFTDPRDFATCVFNFNLSKFVEEGYSKHIYVSQSNISAFKDHNDFSQIEKQKIVLKTLLLLTYINKYHEEIKKVNESLYHHPLLLTLVNSVEVEKSDLELFFRELEKVAKNEIKVDLLIQAKQELVQEFNGYKNFEFENLEHVIDEKLIKELDYNDILRYVFNAKTPSNIEVLKIPGNRQELVLKLSTTEKPFALIKIGDISSWLKDKLEGYEINESFDNQSYFLRINSDDSDINILMGSRSFYEGWDSNRPNILLFINIGVGNDAKKFVLQSVGRGVRIEPQKNQRKRLQNLYNDKEIEEEVFKKVKDLIMPIETLYVFGTNAKNLNEIIKTLKEEKQDMTLGNEFIINPEAKDKTLLIPIYKTAERIYSEESELQKYFISKEDFEITKRYYEYLTDKIILIKYNCDVNILKQAKKSFAEKEKYYNFSETNSLFEPELILERILGYLGVKPKEFDKFKELENEIVHFKKIRFSDGKKYEEIKTKIDLIRQYPEKKKELQNNYGKIPLEEYGKQLKLFEDAEKFEVKDQKIKIKYLANHYYLPVIISETEKIEYLNHIINVKSEVKFIEELEKYLDKPDNVFKQFDWWMFSKLDQTLDEVFIPYYNKKENKITHFKPDFIFWAQKGKRYLILFVDPKGTEYADGYRKIEGYSKIFEIDVNGQKQSREFSYNGFTISTKLLLFNQGGIANVLEQYKRYWFDNFNDFADKVKSFFITENI
ncbi:MAG: DEAD/DEAH box helicase family protein [Candidatus Micrarchaeia archaeon]